MLTSNCRKLSIAVTPLYYQDLIPPVDLMNEFKSDLVGTIPRGLTRTRLKPERLDTLNKWLTSFRFPMFDYALTFHWLPGDKQPVHVDGESLSTPRRCSINFLLTPDTDAYFNWYKPAPLIRREPLPEIAALYPQASVDIDKRHRLPLCALVRTDIPHNVTVGSSPIVLLCCRLKLNPTFDLLKRIYNQSNLMR